MLLFVHAFDYMVEQIHLPLCFKLLLSGPLGILFWKEGQIKTSIWMVLGWAAFFFCCCTPGTQLADGSNAACIFLSVDEEDWNNRESVFASTLVGFFTLVSRFPALLVNSAAYTLTMNTYITTIYHAFSYVSLQTIQLV